jgi:Ca-activated chloride channel family protein
MTDQQLSVAIDRRLVRAVHHSTRYAVVELAAPPALETHVRPSVNIAFVLDRSGSMGGEDKFGLAARAVREGIEQLAPTDRFAVVVYDGEVDVIAPARAADAAAKREAIRSLQEVGPRGSTDLGGGWMRGAEQVAEALATNGVNRVLLLTDGLANHGITDPSELCRHAAELRARGVSTSTFGVGTDFDERLLGGMADAGGGAFRYIERPDQIRPYLAAEVGELLEVTARAAELRIAGPEGLRVSCLAPFPLDRTATGGVLHLGDLVADQALQVVVAVGFPLGEVGREVGVEFSVADRDGRFGGAVTQTWTFADGAANDAQPRERAVDRLVARMYADAALRDAVALNREARFDEARELLRSVARRVRGYAGNDAILRGIVDELEREAEAWAIHREERERKFAFNSRVASLKCRDIAGDALRAPRRR